MSVNVVTGAASGMGHACARRLAGTAEHLVLADLDAGALETVAGELGAIAVVCDVIDPAAVARLADTVRDLGRFSTLVHAAGISPTMSDVRRIMAVDLQGSALVLEAFRPLVAQGSAAVCFASIAPHMLYANGDPVIDALLDDPLAAEFLDRVGEHVTATGDAYAWAKRGVLRLVRREAVVWGPLGGRVNAVSPGLIDTPMNALEFANQPMMQVMLDHTPLGRLGQVDEMAAVVEFLLSDSAAFVSGADLVVDGGAIPGLGAAFGIS